MDRRVKMEDIKIEDLKPGEIHSKPVDIDWRESVGEDMEGWRAYTLVECDCGQEFATAGEYAFVTDSEFSECPRCGEEVYTDGPIMDYYYPVRILYVEEAARAVAGWPVCVVEFRDGITALALTGVGMNLSWEICGAFMALGYLPPVHFCNLPDMAGWENDAWRLPILKAARKSCDIAARDARIRERRVQEMLEKHKGNK